MILAVLSTWALLQADAPQLIAAATPTPSPAASAPAVVRTPPPNAHVWQGITPGSSTQTVRAKYGEPLLVRILPDGSLLDWYPGPTDNAYIIIGEREKVVQYVRAFPLAADGSLDGLTDPYGVKPGFDYAQIKALRGEAQQAHQVAPGTAVVLYPEDQGFVWLYELTADGVHAISLYDDKAPRGSLNAPQVADPHDGTSIGRAYVLHAKNEQEGTRFERYYATHRAGCATWQVANQTVLSLGTRKIDQLDLQCVETKDETSMFFDVTSFVGKT